MPSVSRMRAEAGLKRASGCLPENAPPARGEGAFSGRQRNRMRRPSLRSMTPIGERRTVRHELRTRSVTVAAVRPVAGPLVRVTLTGPDLEGFAAPGPADHVKLLLPDGARRDYTPRAFRADGPELDIDVVLHGDTGPASAWAARVRPGETVGIGGPRGSRLAPEGVRRAVLVADESALPAAARWIDAFAGIPVTALLFVEDPQTSGYLGATPDVDARWFSGPGRLEELDAALRAVPVDDGTFAALAGEAGALIPWRRYLRRELGLPATQVVADGYWKRGVADRDHHAPLDPDDAD